MSYCRWLEGDLYAYRGHDGYIVHVAGAVAGLSHIYQEADAQSFLERLLWLKERGCVFPIEALERLRHEIVASELGLEDADALVLRNVQVIDGALNCTFPIFQFTQEQFDLLFEPGRDIAFIEEVTSRLSQEDAKRAVFGAWERPVRKSEVVGIHGTLFYGFENRKAPFPASRRECDWHDDALNQAQCELNRIARERIDW